MKKENNIILCGIAIAVLASAGFAMSQGTISSADDNYVTPKHVIEEPKEDLELEEDAIEDVEEEKDDDMDNDDSDVEESTIITKPSTSQTNNTVTQKPSTSQTNNTVTQKPETNNQGSTTKPENIKPEESTSDVDKPEVEESETEKPEDDNISE